MTHTATRNVSPYAVYDLDKRLPQALRSGPIQSLLSLVKPGHDPWQTERVSATSEHETVPFVGGKYGGRIAGDNAAGALISCRGTKLYCNAGSAAFAEEQHCQKAPRASR